MHGFKLLNLAKSLKLAFGAKVNGERQFLEMQITWKEYCILSRTARFQNLDNEANSAMVSNDSYAMP